MWIVSYKDGLAKAHFGVLLCDISLYCSHTVSDENLQGIFSCRLIENEFQPVKLLMIANEWHKGVGTRPTSQCIHAMSLSSVVLSSRSN